MFRNLKVRTKILTAFGIVVVLYVIAIVASSIGLVSVADGLENFYTQPHPMIKAALEAQSATRSLQLNVYRAYAEDESAKIAAIGSDIDTATAQLEQAMRDLQTHYEGDQALLSDALSKMNATTPIRQQAMQYINVNDNANSILIIEGEYQAACQAFEDSLDKIITAANNSATAYYNTGMAIRRNCIAILLALAVASIALTVVLTVGLSKGLTRPIFEIEHAVGEMAKGNLQSVVTYTSKDELGQLSDSLRFVLSTLSEYVSHISGKLKSIADGDLNTTMDMEYLGEFASIRTSGAQIINSLNDTLGQINQSAEQVASGSEQVSSGAQALSQGATEQASSVEELAATISRLSDQVNDTAGNAREVNALISATGDALNGCNGQMSEMMEAMQKINESSVEIRKIIKTIEDIAFQTNILALNAAVEAARAGAAGKGFAVVADEVRNLASKSAEAAKNTTTLIEGSLKAVEEGNQLSGATQQSLIQIVENASQITVAMEKITRASDDQAEEIQQVTLGVDQISAVVQTNSATAQQSAAASEELSSQANVLKSLVDQFRLKGSSSQPGSLSYSYIPDDVSGDSFTVDDGKY